jgi:hypothetical protein
MKPRRRQRATRRSIRAEPVGVGMEGLVSEGAGKFNRTSTIRAARAPRPGAGCHWHAGCPANSHEQSDPGASRLRAAQQPRRGTTGRQDGPGLRDRHRPRHPVRPSPTTRRPRRRRATPTLAASAPAAAARSLATASARAGWSRAAAVRDDDHDDASPRMSLLTGGGRSDQLSGERLPTKPSRRAAMLAKGRTPHPAVHLCAVRHRVPSRSSGQRRVRPPQSPARRAAQSRSPFRSIPF